MWKEYCPNCEKRHLDENHFCLNCMHTLLVEQPNEPGLGWIFKDAD